MSLVKTGGGVTDIRGGFGGVYFTRDRTGLHCTAKPRRVKQRTSAQNKQRNAFSRARATCLAESSAGKPRNWLNRWVSYYTYRALNNLLFYYDAFITGDPVPDITGKFIDSGKYGGKRYYVRTDGNWPIWYRVGFNRWYITVDLGELGFGVWTHDATIEGTYTPAGFAAGNPIVKLELLPPPIDYQPPGL